MILTLIIATIIYLVSVWIINLVLTTLFGFVDIWLKNMDKSDRAIMKTYAASKLYKMLLLIYVNLFIVTLLIKYFYNINNPPKVQFVCIIPIVLGISLLLSIKKFSLETTIKEYQQGRFEKDTKPLISFEMQKERDELTGFGSVFGLILFLVYYFFPQSFATGLGFFFLN